MRHFLFTWHEGKPPRDGSGIVKIVRLWRIVRNTPVFIGEDRDTFVSKDQHVLMLAEKLKALPRAAFAKGPHGGYAHALWSLKDQGIASFTEIY